jgi:hypothetical protein
LLAVTTPARRSATLALVLKLAGAAVALAAVLVGPGRSRRPLLLGLILAAAPAILGRWGLLPT